MAPNEPTSPSFGDEVAQLRQQVATLTSELEDERILRAARESELTQIRTLVIAKLQGSRRFHWDRRRALHELEEELTVLLKITPEERGRVPAEHQPSLLKRTQSLFSDSTAAKAWQRWRRKHGGHGPHHH